MIEESEACIIQDEECIECLESRISDKHIDIIYNRWRIDLAEELIEMIGIKELPTPAPSTSTHDIQKDRRVL
jgi:hypothetical protein